jgi:hypothetical protein
VTDQGALGDIWSGASCGPTFDGRVGIDIAAPGESLFTTYDPKSFWATARHNLIQDGLGKYGRASAVSAAAPFATGVIALMLQMHPRLDPAMAKKILHETARRDSFTGAVPNNVWGYGKIDALAALDRLFSMMVQITAVERSGEAAHLTVRALPGRNYRIEFSNDLSPGSWTPLPGYESFAGSELPIQVVDPNGFSRSERFFRAALTDARTIAPAAQALTLPTVRPAEGPRRARKPANARRR